MFRIRLPNKTSAFAYAIFAFGSLLVLSGIWLTITTISTVSVAPVLDRTAETPQEKTLNQVISVLQGQVSAD